MATVPVTGYDKPVQVVTTVDQSGNAVSSGSAVDANNSTAVALLAAAAFTGTATDVSRYTTIQVTVFADQVSASNGLSIQQSSDGTNWDVTDTYTIPITSAGNGKPFRVQVAAKWFRVVYTNGGTNQGAFRLQSILKTADSANSVKTADAYSNENDMGQNQAFDMVWDAVGLVWNRLRAAPYQANQTPIINASGNKANAAAAATLTGTATTTVYISGFECTAAGSTTGLPVIVTVTGVLGGTLSYIFTFGAAGALVEATPLFITFNPPLPASAINTPIVVTLPAGGTGNTNAATVAHGFYQ